MAVDACLAHYAKARQSILIAYSGGLDSTVLLHAASRVVKAAKLELAALHVHHGLSANADAWVDACVEFCRGLRIPLAVPRVTVPPSGGAGLEAAARRVRHQALADHPADWIVLAHHSDDQAETVLHNLLRGTGLRGAAAMPEQHGRVLRPLLQLGRKDLLAYAQSHHLTWVEDESNADRGFTRNFLRREVLPTITARFPRACAQLAAAATRFGEAEALLQELALLDLRGRSPEFPLPIDVFRDLSEARARNLLRALLTRRQVQAPQQRRLHEFVRQLQTAGKDRHPRLDLAHYSLWCEARRLHFKRLG